MKKLNKLCGLLDSDFVVKKFKQVPDDLLSTLIAKSGPIIAATRPLIYNKRTGRYEEGEIRGSITNYDGRITKFKGKDEYDQKVASERARWHYWKSFEPYGFSAKEWK